MLHALKVYSFPHICTLDVISKETDSFISVKRAKLYTSELGYIIAMSSFQF